MIWKFPPSCCFSSTFFVSTFLAFPPSCWCCFASPFCFCLSLNLFKALPSFSPPPNLSRTLPTRWGWWWGVTWCRTCAWWGLWGTWWARCWCKRCRTRWWIRRWWWPAEGLLCPTTGGVFWVSRLERAEEASVVLISEREKHFWNFEKMCACLAPSSTLSPLHLQLLVFSFMSLHCRHKWTWSKFGFSLLLTSLRVSKISTFVKKFVTMNTLTTNATKNNRKSDVQLHGVVALLWKISWAHITRLQNICTVFCWLERLLFLFSVASTLYIFVCSARFYNSVCKQTKYLFDADCRREKI